MATNLDSVTEVFDFADQLALCSSELLRFRLRNRATLSPQEGVQLEALEGQLDDATARVRAAGIARLGTLTARARAEVAQASREAEAFLKRIKRFERVLGMATAVLSLGLAVVGGNPRSVAAAVKGVGDAAQG